VRPGIYIDERRAFTGLDELHHYSPEEISRIEVIDRGVQVRIYTNRFMARARVHPRTLHPIRLP